MLSGPFSFITFSGARHRRWPQRWCRAVLIGGLIFALPIGASATDVQAINVPASTWHGMARSVAVISGTPAPAVVRPIAFGGPAAVIELTERGILGALMGVMITRLGAAKRVMPRLAPASRVVAVTSVLQRLCATLPCGALAISKSLSMHPINLHPLAKSSGSIPAAAAIGTPATTSWRLSQRSCGALPCAAPSARLPVGVQMPTHENSTAANATTARRHTTIGDPVATTASVTPSAPRPPAAAAAAGRAEDARVARIAFRLATAGVAHCPLTRPALGLVLQHLTQFELVDRVALIAEAVLDRGPGIVVIVPGSPAAAAGVRVGDVLLAVDSVPLPPEPDRTLTFTAERAHARADLVQDLLARDGGAPVVLTLLRDGVTIMTRVVPRPACPSQVHLARSEQRNAYADGRHVFLTTGLSALLASDDELAFVIGHEMAHNILQHAAVMRGGTVRGGIARGTGQSGRIVRSAEGAADALGAELMLAAGYDPVAGAQLLRRFGGGGIALFGTHGSAGDRIAAIRARFLAAAPTAPVRP